MSMADTSLDAFMDKKESGSLESDRQKVYDKIDNHGPITCEEVAELMDKRPNDISGRFTELREDGRIEIAGKSDGHRLYETSKDVIFDE